MPAFFHRSTEFFFAEAILRNCQIDSLPCCDNVRKGNDKHDVLNYYFFALSVFKNTVIAFETVPIETRINLFWLTEFRNRMKRVQQVRLAFTLLKQTNQI